MKNQALFSSKDKGKKLKCRLLRILFGALRANTGSLLTSEDIEDRRNLYRMFIPDRI